jgi:hypothetical protein
MIFIAIWIKMGSIFIMDFIWIHHDSNLLRRTNLLHNVMPSSSLQGFSQKYQSKLFDTMCYGRTLNKNVFINPSHCNNKVM